MINATNSHYYLREYLIQLFKLILIESAFLNVKNVNVFYSIYLL
jgi:hypothetical protein